MSQLLSKPLKVFTIYALLVLACSIPAYYFIIDTIWINEIDEHNRLVSASTIKDIRALSLNDRQLKENLAVWNKLQPEKIQQVTALKDDSTYNVYRYNPHQKGDINRFQGLISYFELNHKPFKLTIETSQEESHETILAITLVTILFFIILLVGFVLLNKRITEKLWQPFYNSLQKITNFDLSVQESPDFGETTIAEFAEMNKSLSYLINSNIAVFREQREFIENAAHELQTPLSIVQFKLDLLLQSENLSGAQSAIITDTNKALARVSRVNKNLLLLAKIDNHQFPDTERLLLASAIMDIIALLDDFAGGKKIAIREDISSIWMVNANRTLLEILITNLITNAIRHNISESYLSVQLSGNLMTITNPGVAALDGDNAFKRFHSASPNTPGSGLGLSIVREICNRYGWTLSYAYADGIHVFSVLFN